MTQEHAFFFAYGTGANGKSVFLNTIARLMGDYHTTAPMEAFIASRADRHPTEMAGLRGARLVTAVETEEGRRWNESRIKAVTGGDPIAARFMRRDFFTFIPQFKLLVVGNHKPRLRNVDEAMRRRLHLIPFNVTIPPEDRDEHLADRLREEWPGILSWAIEGGCEWGMVGLQPPEAVRKATDAYFQTEDTIATWMEECCDIGPNLAATSADIYQSYRRWCDKSGEYAVAQKQVSQALEDRGFERHRIGAKSLRGFRGLGVRPPDFDPDPGAT